MTAAPLPKTHADRLRLLWKLGNRTESLQIRLFGFSGMSLLRKTPVLLLETTGRRTGRRHRTGVAYWRLAEEIFIGGGAGGMTRVDWVANLRAHPAATVWIRRQRTQVVARELVGPEYERARSQAFEIWPNVPKYERASGRRIPYFSLSAANEARN